MEKPEMTKAFISVAGEDVEKAREVAKEFTANLIYLYDESGQHGVDMWNEEANVDSSAQLSQ